MNRLVGMVYKLYIIFFGALARKMLFIESIFLLCKISNISFLKYQALQEKEVRKRYHL